MLTPTQKKVIDFIEFYIREQGQAPTLLEIAAGIGIHSKGVVHRHVQALAQAGLIELLPGRQRGIRLVAPPAAAPTYSLPLLGRIAAGRPLEAIPDHDTLDLAGMLLGPKRYALEVRGDSMMEAGILPGDIVIIERCDSAKNGDIVVALIDGMEATLKRLHCPGNGTVVLVAEHPTLPPMVYAAQRITIQGVVVAQLRSYR